MSEIIQAVIPTIYLFGDAEPTSTSELIKDFNAAMSLSPTNNISVTISMGDMTKSSGSNMKYTVDALNGSSLKNADHFFVIGNHEYDNKSDAYSRIKSAMGTHYPLTKFSGDSSGLTYHFKVGSINVFILNIYYNNNSGKVSQAMYDWLNTETAKATGFILVCFHDPMYPYKYHVGNSLDADKAMRDKLQAMFVKNHVNIAYGGHAHYSNIQDVGGVLHINSGVIGQGTGQGEDSFATLNYVFVNSDGKLQVTLKQDKSNSWSNPTIINKVLGGGSPPPPPPLKYACESGSCIEKAGGSYTTNTCNNDCTPPASTKPILISIEPTSFNLGWYPFIVVVGDNFDALAYPNFYNSQNVYVGHGGDHVRHKGSPGSPYGGHDFITFNSNFKQAEILTLRVENSITHELSDKSITVPITEAGTPPPPPPEENNTTVILAIVAGLVALYFLLKGKK